MADEVPIEHLDFSPVLLVIGIVLFVALLETFLVGSESTLERVVGACVVGGTVAGVSIWIKRLLE